MKTSKKAAAAKKAPAPKSKTKKTAAKPVPVKPAARPINDKDIPLEKLAAWLAKGMAVVKQRLEQDLPGMLKEERPASELAHLFGMLRDMNTLVGDALKPLGDAASNCANNLVPKAFERENLKSFTTADGYRVTVSTAYRASIKTDQKIEAYEWLRANGLSELITETVNAGTLSAAGKAMVEEKGLELPEHLFNAAFMPTTSLTKVAKK